jgi:predicted metal-dependent phosphotriesterase family hydrolase
LGCDRVGLEIFNPDASRLTTLAALAERGVTQEQIDQTLIGNPRRFFS